ncbi:oligosaccharide flippase family protein [Bowmanella sp. JS7-9]|uniref:Oligosaccharide flippase family protein n=1 Tax=Pseudobowmanella zhangzhouensis TaxID=1537679 RepID=A0ABW1XG16_9ALTE|nr:oligosaccharide flippase family protein [Bowmanella sp. JS7-9]TBX20851.1 hypothetical protein TK45_13825 [Bowmanella sp. JS7-9]
MSQQSQTKVVSSVGWSFLTRYSNKFIGLLNTLVLARLLTPEDFGIVALSSIFINFLLALTEANLHLYLIRHKEDNDQLFSSVWTASVMQAVVVSIFMAIGAPYAADFFEQPLLEQIIYCLIIVRLLDGCRNVGIYIAQKHLNFKLDFKVTFYSKISSVIFTIGLAIWLQSYWALVLGQICSSAVALIYSYVLHPFRPHFSLYQWREILAYSKATIPATIAGYLNTQIHMIAAGRLGTTEFIGRYHMALNIGAMFTFELMLPIIRGLAPNFSIVKDSGEGEKFFKMATTLAVYAFVPLGVGINAVAPEFIQTLLGEQWLPAAPMLAWFSLFFMISGIMMFLSGQFLIILGKEQLSNRLVWMRTAMISIAIALTVHFGSYTDIPRSLFLYTIAALPLILYFVSRAMAFSLRNYLTGWIPPVLAALLMWSMLHYLPLQGLPFWLLLPVKIVIGGLTYLLTLTLLYKLRGKPENSVEAFILNKIPRKHFRSGK